MMVGKKKRPDQEAPTWGGKRPGAGDPLSDTPLVHVTGRVSQEDRTYLEAIGEGNVGAGIRELVRRDRERTEQTP